ncbi:MAG TPA: tetratricopeptide repeat protein [Polyangiaceae bacterium]|nr:tetratricopeptide repeat protein [Polyangiaceae bacterium]
MSGDPERLLSISSGSDPLERELLGSVRHVGPPDGAKDQAWRAIAGQIAVVAAVGAVSSSTAAAASKAGIGTMATWALSAKIAAVAAAGGLALGGGYMVLHGASESSPAVAPRTVVAPPTHAAPPAVPLAPKEAEAVAPPEDAPAEGAPSRKLEPHRLDALQAESALLTQARAELRSGNAAGAQASLDRLQAQFPKGMLTQEREVLAIEVLSAQGNVEGAKRRARAFVKAYPKSPHSGRLARFLD